MKAKPLGKLINKTRNAMHIDHITMAEDLNIEKERVRLIEQGKTMITQTELDQIQRYLNISLEDLGHEPPYDASARPKHVIGLFRSPTTPFSFKKTLNAMHVSLQKGFRLKWKASGEATKDFLFPNVDSFPETPHLYIKVFVIFFALFGLAFFIDEYSTVNLALAMLTPFAWLVLMQELHYPKTLSFFKTLLYFAVGGMVSIFLVGIIREVTGYPEGFVGDIVTGVIEEFAKLLLVILILRRVKPKQVITGMLIGFAVGAGFDVFESADYGIIALLSSENGYYDMIQSGAWRGVFALIGIGHHYWTAMLAAGLMFLRKKQKVQYSGMLHPSFMLLFTYVVLIHAFWNYSNGLIMMIAVMVLSLMSFILMLHKAIHHQETAPIEVLKEEGDQCENLYIA